MGIVAILLATIEKEVGCHPQSSWVFNLVIFIINNVCVRGSSWHILLSLWWPFGHLEIEGKKSRRKK